MTDQADIVKRLTSTSVVIGNLPKLPGYNGSVLTIDDEEAARCAADIDAGIAEITRLRAEAEALRKALNVSIIAMRAPLDDWKGELERKALDACAAIAATKEQQA